MMLDALRVKKFLQFLMGNSQTAKYILWRSFLVSGLYYKTIMIIIMTIISDAPNCGVTYNHN